MTVEFQEQHNGKVLWIRLTGKLGKDDYETFVPEVERLIREHGKIRVLMVMEDFHGWGPGGLWEDVKFDLKHFRDIERLAMVGEKKWQEGMAAFCKPFTSAEIRYFGHDELDQARAWIAQDLATAEARASRSS